MHSRSTPSERSGLQKRICNIVVGNHRYIGGIGEVLYTLCSYLSPRYETLVSFDVLPEAINIFVDEFSIVGSAEYLKKIKDDYSGTKFVLLATELITEVKVGWLTVGLTFNYFNYWEDRRYALAMAANWLKMRKASPYMYRRFEGFVEALKIADLVISIHPGIVDTFELLPLATRQILPPSVILYPEIDARRIANSRRLRELPSGFVLTGTLTKSRKRVIRSLHKAAVELGVAGSVYTYLAFSEAGGFHVDNGRAFFDFDFDEGAIAPNRDEKPGGVACDRIYNLNPPRTANWPYSSPMRILRAILFGYIPVVTRKFDDHELESVALLWDSSAKAVAKLWLDASIGRDGLIKNHVVNIEKYNAVARKKNEAVDRGFELLEPLPAHSRENLGAQGVATR